jgi:hypothetical protein
MRMRLLPAAFILAAGFRASALADPPEEELTAAPGSIAYGMIENADAEGVFELVHNGQVTVRHVGSGLVCHFMRDGAGGRLLLFPGLARGDDVGCDSMQDRVSITLYATRYPPPWTLDQSIADAEAAIRQRFPDAVPHVATLVDPGLPFPRRTAHFIVTHNAERMFTSASVAQIGDWTIKLRYSAYAPDDAAARQAEIAAGLVFAGALEEIAAPPNP